MRNKFFKAALFWFCVCYRIVFSGMMIVGFAYCTYGGRLEDVSWPTEYYLLAIVFLLIASAIQLSCMVYVDQHREEYRY
jgi:hypothetical protein